MRRLGVLVVAGLMLAGCGGGSSFPTVAGHPDPKAVADKADCGGYKPDSGNKAAFDLGAATYGFCQFHGTSIDLMTFKSSKVEDAFVKEDAQVFDLGTLAVGDGFLFETQSKDLAAALVKAVGGHTV